MRLQPTERLRTVRIPGRAVLDNISARLIAILALAAATVVVARVGGAADVGVLALLRVVPGLFGVLAACGLPGAMGYFLAGPEGTAQRLWPTILAVLAAGTALGTAAWFVLMPAVHAILFPTTTTLVMVLAGLSVATQLPVAVGKSSLQGLDDLKGSNVVTAAEEVAFLPAFGVGYLLGLRGPLLLVVTLIAADVLVAAGAWLRLGHRVHARGMRFLGRPDRPLARRVVTFGLLGQVGGLVGLLNLRLDFLVLGSMAGPGPLGVYAVASKFAELVKLPALAVTWVTYPRVARQGAAGAARDVARQLPWLLGLGLAVAAALALAASPLLPALYGQEFAAAVTPAVIIVAGLVASPAGGLASGFLLGTRRPGTNSAVLAVGLVVTIVLDVLLIPSQGVVGAAVASAVAYLVTDLTLLGVLRHLMARAR